VEQGSCGARSVLLWLGWGKETCVSLLCVSAACWATEMPVLCGHVRTVSSLKENMSLLHGCRLLGVGRGKIWGQRYVALVLE
jgi:hypothetical protein